QISFACILHSCHPQGVPVWTVSSPHLNPEFLMKSLLLSSALLLGSLSFADTLFDLGDVALDGSPGENTYIARNDTSGVLSYDAGTPALTHTLTGSSSYSYFVSYFDAHTLSNVGD